MAAVIPWVFQSDTAWLHSLRPVFDLEPTRPFSYFARILATALPARLAIAFPLRLRRTLGGLGLTLGGLRLAARRTFATASAIACHVMSLSVAGRVDLRFHRVIQGDHHSAEQSSQRAVSVASVQSWTITPMVSSRCPTCRRR